MANLVGKTILHYKIIEQVGHGGMGIVYKAQDTNLDRFVTLKFLPPHLGQAEDEKKRFIHEAKGGFGAGSFDVCIIHENK